MIEVGQGTGLCPDLFPDTNLSPVPLRLSRLFLFAKNNKNHINKQNKMLTYVVFDDIIKLENNENHSKKNQEEIWGERERDRKKEICEKRLYETGIYLQGRGV